MSKSIKKGLFWKLMERGFTQGMLLVLTIILARLMSPKEFGTLTLLMVFINLMQVFLDSGMGSALIQKKHVTDVEYSTVFYFNLSVCIVLYIFMYFFAPVVASFYKEPAYTSYIRVLSIIILISGLRNIQNSKASIDMDFKRLFISAFLGVVISGAVGIVMAYRGFGIWALIAQNVINALVATIVLWLIDKWLPVRGFSFEALKELWEYGWKIFLASLISSIYDNISVLIIGKKYTREDLAYYDQGKKYPQVIISNINASVDGVIFPAMSKKQDDTEELARLTKKSIVNVEYILMPVLAMLAVCSVRLVRVLLTDKWLPCVPYVLIFCFFYLLYPFNTANTNVLKAVGKSSAVLKLEMIKRGLGIVLLLLTMPFGVFAIAVGIVVGGVINWIMSGMAIKPIINYSLFEEIKWTLPNLIMTAIMTIGAYACGYIPLENDIIVLVIQIVVALIIYITLSVVTKDETFVMLINTVKSMRKKLIK